MAWVFNKKKETKYGYINGRLLTEKEVEELGLTTTELLNEKMLDKTVFNKSNAFMVRLGGTGRMYQVSTDADNYLYKPAVTKYTGEKEPFRGMVQECGYEVQKIVDPESSVLCRYFDCGDFSGSIQLKVSTSPKSRRYGDVQDEDPMELNQSEINQFMREFVTDYLLCNFDAHGNNFITDKNGVIRGVDKEQSFRYINDERSLVPNIDFSPNTDNYGEREPIYHAIFRQYSEKKLDIDLGVLDKYISRVEKVKDEDYRKIFEPYAHALKRDPNEADELLDKIVSRKKNIRVVIDNFTSEMTERRENVKSGGQK